MVKIVCVLETLFFSSEKESVLLSSGDDLNPIHAKVRYESFATVGEIRVYWRADFKSGSRVLKKVF